MAIYTPAEYANLARPTNIPDALAKGAMNVLCKGAPYLAGYGLATGNLPAIAYGAGVDIACGLPIIPGPDPSLPVTSPGPGGCREGWYRCDFKWVRSNAACQKGPGENLGVTLLGPLVPEEIGGRSFFASCLNRNSQWTDVHIRQQGGAIFVVTSVNYELGDYWTWTATPIAGQDDSICAPPVTKTPFPPGYQLPPGYPDAPRIPGGEGDQPIYGPDDPPNAPPRRYIPYKIPDIPLPPVIAPIIPIYAPITVPVSIPIDISPTFNLNGTFNIQIDPDGNIRTPPDLICDCNDPTKPPAITCPETDSFSIPYFSCGTEEGYREATLEVVRSSVPVGLFDKLLSSANLAQIGCEASGGEDVAPSLLSQGVFPDLLVAPWYGSELPEGVVSVELRVKSFSEKDLNELSVFPGAKQYKFGSICFCRPGSEAGSEPVWVWDKKTYAVIPRIGGRYRVRLLLKPGTSWELWDTGER